MGYSRADILQKCQVAFNDIKTFYKQSFINYNGRTDDTGEYYTEVVADFLGLMHTLFALEDIYGFKIDKLNGEVCIKLDKDKGTSYISLLERFTAWQKEAEKYRNGEISKEEYDRWRYTYPEVEVQRTRDALDELRNNHN